MHASRCFIKSSSIYDHVLCVTVLPIQKLSKNNICILPPYYVFETTQGCIKHPYISLNETFFSDDDDDDNAKVDVLYIVYYSTIMNITLVNHLLQNFRSAN